MQEHTTASWRGTFLLFCLQGTAFREILYAVKGVKSIAFPQIGKQNHERDGSNKFCRYKLARKPLHA